jgi:hypothetical protein
VAVAKGLGETWDVIFLLGDGARALINIRSWEGTGVEGRGGSCASKDTGSTQALASSGPLPPLEMEASVKSWTQHPWSAARGEDDQEAPGAKRWTEMASCESGSTEMA